MSKDAVGSTTPDQIKNIRPHWRGRIYAIIGLSIAVIVVVTIATTIGSVKIPILTTLRILISQLPLVDFPPDWTSSTETILLNIRLPRIILAGLIGAALSVAGATYQGLFRNPLADPYLIGAAQGAALGAVIGFLLPIEFSAMGFGLIPILAFTGAVVSVAVVYILARVGKTVPVTTLILAGVALGALWGSIYSYLIIISGDKIHGIIFWVMGSFSLSEWSEVSAVLPYMAIGIIVILLYSRSLNVMQLDEEQAKQLGINVERTKLILLAAATLITAAAVSFVGTIGFVGIIIPHAVRLIWGLDHRFLLPLSVLTGAIFLILADLIARTVMAPTEIPIGIITALCGVPFFLYLLRRRKGIIYF
ncbi:MAG: iron chelate uptake ABC transporter family permease subunit [Dehalococcoidales bacterium]|nr:MAG: iron chelate uptake ABC transporter family permease subunit [Dehalococcoidales bacterium]